MKVANKKDIQAALLATGYQYDEETADDTHVQLEKPVEGETPPDRFPEHWGMYPTWRDEQVME